jgi:fluoride ion exporter CrcB/FEX
MAYFIVFLGAGIGGALRHGINVAAFRLLGSDYPYGTLTVNVAGSLAMGLLAGWFAHKLEAGPSVATVPHHGDSGRLYHVFNILVRSGSAV